MKVAIDVSAVPAQPAGAGVYILELVRALAALDQPDLELALVARRDDESRWRALAPQHEVVAVAPARRPVRLVWEQSRGGRLARRLGADVWHGPHYTMPAALRVPAVVTIHDLTFLDHPEWHERAKVLWFPRMIRRSVRKAAVLVSVSAATTRRLEALLDPRQPVLTIPHGVDHHRFHPSDGAARADLDRLAALGVAPPFVAFQGTVEPRKNVTGLVRAFARVAPAHPDLRLVVAGREGWGSAELDTAVAASGVGDRVVRLGYVDDDVVPALFRQATVVAYPAHEEGFGLPALEALACGAPLVTTTGTAMADVVEDAAVLVPPADDAALADAIGRLVDDPGEQARLSAAGPPVAARYTWRACAEGHVQAYARAASS